MADCTCGHSADLHLSKGSPTHALVGPRCLIMGCRCPGLTPFDKHP